MVMALHEDLLAQSGRSWHSPPQEVTWNQERRERRDEIIAGYECLGTFGIKDPRRFLVLKGWVEALPNLRLVGTFRHPAAVARSLQTRNGVYLGRGMRLWTYYNRLLLRYRDEFAFDLISFDLASDDYRRRLGMIAKGLAVEPLDWCRILRRATAQRWIRPGSTAAYRYRPDLVCIARSER